MYVSTIPSVQMTVMYAEIGMSASTTLSSPTDERVQYSILDTVLLSAASTTTPAPPASSTEIEQIIEEVEPVNKADLHPLGLLYSCLLTWSSI